MESRPTAFDMLAREMEMPTLVTRLTSVAVAIPTKHRPNDLAETLRSVLAQNLLPQRIIVIDQSTDQESQRLSAALFERMRGARTERVLFDYVRDPRLSGLTAARNRALKLVREEIVLFLDDDVTLEPDFLKEVVRVYSHSPEAAGVSGIITNYHPPPFPARVWLRAFTLGPFWDDRQPVYWGSRRLRERAPLRVSRLGGGLMSFRMAAIQGIWFDENLRGPCVGEDVEFSARLGRDAVLLIAPGARLIHRQSSAERRESHWLASHARAMSYIFWRNWNHSLRNRLCFAWLNVGYAIAAGLASMRRLSPLPYVAWRTAVHESRALAGMR
jgi:GT2 family glycosyltransferase